METIGKVKTNIEAVVEANRRIADENLVTAQKELSRERKARRDAEAVLAETTLALSDMRRQQATMTEMQQELEATVSQMREELDERDRELAQLKPGHKAAMWAQPKTVDELGRATYAGMKSALTERDAQLDEAVAIIRELRDALQGATETGAVSPQTGKGPACPACGFTGDRHNKHQAETVFSDSIGEEVSVSGSDAYDVRTPTPTQMQQKRMAAGAGASGSAPPMFWVTKEASTMDKLLPVLQKATALGKSKK